MFLNYPIINPGTGSITGFVFDYLVNKSGNK